MPLPHLAELPSFSPIVVPGKYCTPNCGRAARRLMRASRQRLARILDDNYDEFGLHWSPYQAQLNS